MSSSAAGMEGSRFDCSRTIYTPEYQSASRRVVVREQKSDDAATEKGFTRSLQALDRCVQQIGRDAIGSDDVATLTQLTQKLKITISGAQLSSTEAQNVQSLFQQVQDRITSLHQPQATADAASATSSSAAAAGQAAPRSLTVEDTRLIQMLTFATVEEGANHLALLDSLRRTQNNLRTLAASLAELDLCQQRCVVPKATRQKTNSIHLTGNNSPTYYLAEQERELTQRVDLTRLSTEAKKNLAKHTQHENPQVREAAVRAQAEAEAISKKEGLEYQEYARKAMVAFEMSGADLSRNDLIPGAIQCLKHHGFEVRPDLDPTRPFWHPELKKSFAYLLNNNSVQAFENQLEQNFDDNGLFTFNKERLHPEKHSETGRARYEPPTKPCSEATRQFRERAKELIGMIRGLELRSPTGKDPELLKAKLELKKLLAKQFGWDTNSINFDKMSVKLDGVAYDFVYIHSYDWQGGRDVPSCRINLWDGNTLYKRDGSLIKIPSYQELTSNFNTYTTRLPIRYDWPSP